VLGNVLLNLFLVMLNEQPVIAELANNEVLTWPPIVLQIIAIEILVAVPALVLAFLIQIRRRDLI
jgi:hypothetical protein